MLISRRNFLIGITAPAIVRASSLMPVVMMEPFMFGVRYQTWPLGGLRPTIDWMSGTTTNARGMTMREIRRSVERKMLIFDQPIHWEPIPMRNLT